MPGGNGSFLRLLVVNVTIGGFGGSIDLSGTRLLGGLNLDMIVFGAGTGIGGGRDGGRVGIFGRIGVVSIGGGADMSTGAVTCGKIVGAIGTVGSAVCGKGGSGGGGGGGGMLGAEVGKLGLCVIG